MGGMDPVVDRSPKVKCQDCLTICNLNQQILLQRFRHLFITMYSDFMMKKEMRHSTKKLSARYTFSGRQSTKRQFF